MGRKVAQYSRADISRAIQGARDGGITVGRIEIEGPKIVIFAQDAVPEPKSDLEKWRVQRDARKAQGAKQQNENAN